jgi:hypothetical protein
LPTPRHIRQKELYDRVLNKLVDDLSPYLWVDEVRSKNCTSGIQPIDQRHIVASGLRWLRRHDHSGLEDIIHISCSSSWRIVKSFIDVVIQNLNNFFLPTTDEDLATLATSWSYHGLVLALDGFCPPERNHVMMTVVVLPITSVVTGEFTH